MKRNQMRARRQPSRLGTVDIPHINNKPKQTRCLRYSAIGLSATPAVVNSDDLRYIMLAGTSATTNGIVLIDSIRLRRVGISAVLDGTGGSATINFAWQGPNVPDILDTSFVGVGVPTNKSYYPPEGTSCEWWYDSSSTNTNMFALSLSSLNSGDAIVFLDLEFEYILHGGTSTTITTSAFPATGIAYLTLSQSGDIFVPLGLTTVTR